ncbi:MAG: MotA/TolQ/ExbB proton channel family protein [Bradymonadaceae bacterium]|nr:MotA/TolQ/ExbB proton channel family protein [Lujinxingiaceae bacterium]
MYPIYLCSLLAVVIFIKKINEFRISRLGESTWIEPVLEHIEEGEFERASDACAQSAHPVSAVVAAMLETFLRRPDRVEAEAARVGSLTLQRLEKNVGVLSFIAQAAPLLGLLGTVIGMVELFMGLGTSGIGNVDATQLSSGIWKALLTTAAGLMVAVPALAGYVFLNSRTDRFRLALSDSIARVLTALPAQPATRPGQPAVPTLVREAADAI